MADQVVVEDRSLRLRREPGALEAFARNTARAEDWGVGVSHWAGRLIPWSAQLARAGSAPRDYDGRL